jgi:hypothetical protein
LVIASGLSVGKEGPSVHVACCIGAIVASWFQRFSQSQGLHRYSVSCLFVSFSTFKEKCEKSSQRLVLRESQLLLDHQLAAFYFLLRFQFPPSCFRNFKRVSTGDEPDVSHQNYVEKLRVRTGRDIYAVRQWIPLSCPATLTLLF